MDEVENPTREKDGFEGPTSPTKSPRGKAFAKGFSAKAKAGFDSAKSHLDGAKADVLEEADRIKQLKKFQLMDLEIFASSEQADMLEAQTDQRNREKWGGILHPESTVSVVYNQMHVGFLLYMLAVLPVRTAFEIVPQPGDTEFTVDVVIDVLIFLDIGLNFKKFTKDGANLETDSRVLKMAYLKGWFIIDLLAVMPFNYIFMAMQENDSENLAKSTRFLRLVRIPRFIRLMKLAKLAAMRDLMTLLKNWCTTIGISGQEVEFAVRIGSLVVVILGVAHLVGCIWLHIGRQGLRSAEGWMVNNHLPVDCESCENVQDGKYIHEQYVDSLYWAMVTMSSVGYGDILPTTTRERLSSVAVITLGAFLYAYIIGSFSTIMATLDYDRARYDTKMRTVSNYLRFIGSDDETTMRVNKFYDFRFANKLMFQDENIVEELPAKLRAELVLSRYQKIVDRIPFIHGLGEDVVVGISLMFKEFAVLPMDYITHAGDPYRELLILTKGGARTIPPAEEEADGDGEDGSISPRGLRSSTMSQPGDPTASPRKLKGMSTVIEYHQGCFFGEQAFLGLADSRSVSIRAKTYCELVSLHPADIEHIVADCPALQARLRKYLLLKQQLTELAEDHEVSELEAEMLLQDTEDTFEEDEEGGEEADPMMTSSIGDLIGGSSPRAKLAGGAEFTNPTSLGSVSPRAGVALGLSMGDDDSQSKILAALGQLMDTNAKLVTQNAAITKRLAAIESSVQTQ